MKEDIRLGFLQGLDMIHQEYNKEPTFDILRNIQAGQISLIVDILKALIAEKGKEDNYVWEKSCLVRAMLSIENNILKNRSGKNVAPTFIWQTLPLAEIELALTPRDERSEQLNHLDKYKKVTFNELMAYCQSIML